MQTDWQMPRRGDRCCVSGREFAIDETFCVVLRETPDGYDRREYALTFEPEAELGEIARWRTRRPPPNTKRAQPLDTAAIYRLFRQLDEPGSTPQVQFRFILALLLWRKKVLRYDGTMDEDGREWWQFRAPDEDEPLQVERPALDEQEMDRLSAQLEQLLADPPENLIDVVEGTEAGEEAGATGADESDPPAADGETHA